MLFSGEFEFSKWMVSGDVESGLASSLFRMVEVITAFVGISFLVFLEELIAE